MAKGAAATASQSRAIPDDFPVPDVSDADVAFGAKLSLYLKPDQIPEDLYGMRHGNKFVDAVNGLFFNGGKLADYGLKFRPGIDRNKALRALRALLCSFEPPHEVKVGTVAFALSKWCEPIPDAA